MFLLLLMVLGTASVRAQVRIGGNGAPNAAAVLDLNVDDSATPAGNKGALALPRVSLASTTAQLNGATPVTGMLVYNTNAAVGVGIYVWDGLQWKLIDAAANTLPHRTEWFRILDSTLNIPSLPGQGVIRIPASGVRPFDLCIPGNGTSSVYTPAPNAIDVATLWDFTTPAYTVRIICFRPLVVN